jgi:hypothetical protein
MAVTMDSGPAGGSAYVPPPEVLKRVDVRWCADLCSDTGAKVGSSTDTAAMAAALALDPNFLASIDDACGALEAHCLIGMRYTHADLAAIAASATVARALLWRFLSRLTMCFLWERRPRLELPKAYEEVLKDLEKLRSGELIFGTVQIEQAGLPSSRQESRRDVDRRNLASTRMARFFGDRGDRGAWAQGGGP